MNPGDDPVLVRLRTTLDARYGRRIERVVLFGSRAHGVARPDSDYDVAVFLRDMESTWAELGPLAEITTEILVETGAVISAKPFRAGSHDGRDPQLRAITDGGVML